MLRAACGERRCDAWQVRSMQQPCRRALVMQQHADCVTVQDHVSSVHTSSVVTCCGRELLLRCRPAPAAHWRAVHCLPCRAGGRAAGFGAADDFHDDSDGQGNSPGLALLSSSLAAISVQLGYRPEGVFHLGPVSHQVGSARGQEQAACGLQLLQAHATGVSSPQAGRQGHMAASMLSLH